MRDNASLRRRLKLRQLDALLAVAESGSMAKAAEHLSVSQPAVSKAIADMEHALGVRLFDRSTQGVEPNLYGQALLKWARAVFDDVQQGIKEIEFLADPTAGELKVSAMSTVVAGILPHIIDRIHSQFPRISVHITQMTTPRQSLRDLRERNIDLLVARLPKPIDDDIYAEELFLERTFVVAGAISPWGRRRKIGLGELVNEPWTLPPPDSVIGFLVAEAFRASGFDVPRSSVVATSYDLLITLMTTGRYLSTCPRSVLEFSARRPLLKILPVHLPIPDWPIAIMSLKNRTITPVAQVFIKCAHEIAKPLASKRA